MWNRIAAFELRYQLRSPLFFVSAVLFFLFSFGATTVDQIQIGSRGNVHVNSPFALLQTLGIMNIFAIFAIVAFVANVIVRDDETGFAPILRTTRIRRVDYLCGRFLGAMLVAMLVSACVPLGILVGSWMPWIDSEKVGPLVLRDYLFALAVFGLPTVLVMGAGFFSVATVTRSMMWTYVGAVVFLLFYLTSRVMLRDPSHDGLSALLDPFGLAPLNLVTRYWTTTERNTLLPPLMGPLLYNRLIWLGAGAALFGFTLARFRFAVAGAPSGTARVEERSPPALMRRPTSSTAAGGPAGVTQFLALTRFELRLVLRSPAFFVLLAIGLLNAIGSLAATVEIRGVEYIPVTRAVVDLLRGTFSLTPLLIAIYYGGELVWRERERRISDIVDACPTPGWAFLIPKVLAITLVLLVSLLCASAGAILFQLAKGFFRIEPSAYLLWFVLPGLIDAVLVAVLSVFVQSLVPTKPAGWAVMLIYVVASVALGTAGFEHKLYLYGDSATVPLSDMNGMGRFWIGRAWQQTYWLWVAGMMLVSSHLLWQRGADSRLGPRLAAFGRGLRGPAGALLGAFGLAAVATGGWVYYNTDILNPYEPRPAREARMANYERTIVLPFENLPEPTITDVHLQVALHPDQGRVVTHGTYTIVNRTATPLEEIHIQWTQQLASSRVTLAGATVRRDYPDLGHQILALTPAMLPGEQRLLEFDSVYGRPGFRNDRPFTRVVPNGSFVDSGEVAPFLGAPRDGLLQERARRHKYGLESELRPPKLEDTAANRMSGFRHDSDWVTATIELSTDADQTPITPGVLISDSIKDGRRTVVTRNDGPMLYFFSMLSGHYAEKHDVWTAPDGKHVDLAVYYHAPHDTNVQRMLDVMKTSLEVDSAAFSPFQFHQARILEFPAYAEFAQSFAGTVPYSEAIGFVQAFQPGQGEDKLDLVTFVTAHEIGHQWWGHQLPIADKQGGTMLIESFAQYSALLTMERIYGKPQIRKFLKYELDGYLRARGGELVEELPLDRVENQPYIHYQKGALAMYRLKEVVGEAVVNRALSRLLAQFAFRGPPFASTTDFLRLLREEAGPAHDQLISDLFERITLYDLKASDAHARRQADGRYALRFTVEARKLYADGQGKERETPLDEHFTLGAFTAEPGRVGYRNDSVVSLESRALHTGKTEVEMVVTRLPAFVGVDPFNVCIDRNSDDNLTPVTLE